MQHVKSQIHWDYIRSCFFNSYFNLKSDSDLNNIRHKEEFQRLLEIVRERGGHEYILRQYSSYSQNIPEFTYQPASHPDLVRLRKKYDLDTGAGTGDEVSRIINLMKWVHNIVRHDGNSKNPAPRNAMHLIETCKKEGRGINCRMMAIILNEVYLSMGFKSRFVTCMPKGEVFEDCHVINMVYSECLGKWLWMDPTFEAYVMDEKDNLLSIREVREGLISGKTLKVCKELNWNGRPYEGGGDRYLHGYMAKNLFRFSCALNSEFGTESKEGERVYVFLNPTQYNPNSVSYGYKYPQGEFSFTEYQTQYYTDNPDVFWKKPED